MRTKLFVPASRPELFGKAMAGDADALSFDLEDAVPQARKAEAREALRIFLASGAAAHDGKTLIVRINPVESEHFAADVQAVVQPGLHIVNLPIDAPFVQRAEAVVALARRLGLVEALR